MVDRAARLPFRARGAKWASSYAFFALPAMVTPAEDQLERQTDSLYGLPLTDFIPARDGLAKQLRAEGQRELATEVKALRKPSVAAWVVNQLARERELDVQRLVNAGIALAETQAGGGSAEAFATVRRDEQHALERLAGAARETIAREGIGAAAFDRVLQTLRAASLTPEGRELLKRGRLSEELEPPGFEAISALGGATIRPTSRQAKTPTKDRRKALAEARRVVKEARTQEREAAQAAREAEREAERAQKAADERREAAAKARTLADKAAEALRDAEARLGELQEA